MKRSRTVVLMRLAAAFAALLVAGCGGGGSAPALPIPPAPVATPGLPAPSPTAASANVAITISLPSPQTSARGRIPAYVSSATKSATVTVTPGGGSALTPVTIACSSGACSGTVTAPYGVDTFTVNLYDGAGGSGNLLSTGTTSQNIAANVSDAVHLTVDGVVHSFALVVGTANAGSSTAVAVSVNVLDADGATIIGPGSYATANGMPLTVTLSDSDTSGVTSLPQTSVTGPATLSMNYSGLAFTSPVTITASAPGFPNATASFAPALQPIVIATSDTLNPSFTGVDLYAASGSGSSESLSASEAGWTNFGKNFTLTVHAGCSAITTLASGTGTSFTANVAAAPAAGECTATLADGLGQSATLTFAYTQFAYTGSTQTVAVPSGVTQAQFDAAGGNGGTATNGGGTSAGGLGATIDATVPVTPGMLTLGIGGVGGNGAISYPFSSATQAGGSGGYNGGGAGGAASVTVGGSGLPTASGGGGGGATTVSEGATVLVVAGGGGGAGPNCPLPAAQDVGGSGGWPSGAANTVYYATCLTDDSGTPIGYPGNGGTQTAGGSGGASDGNAGASAGGNGSSLLGGAGGGASSAPGGTWAGGGGGGGYFGGGGGGGAFTIAAPGGGGSSYCGGCTPLSTGTATATGGSYTGNGSLTIIF